MAQLEKEVPENLALFGNFAGLPPEKVLNQATRVLFSSLPLVQVVGKDKEEVESQHRELPFIT